MKKLMSVISKAFESDFSKKIREREERVSSYDANQVLEQIKLHAYSYYYDAVCYGRNNSFTQRHSAELQYLLREARERLQSGDTDVIDALKPLYDVMQSVDATKVYDMDEVSSAIVGAFVELEVNHSWDFEISKN